MFQDTVVIIPAYNELDTIFDVVSGLRNLYPELPVVVINDGSTDDTALEAGRAGAIVINHSFNLGYGATIQTGYKYALCKGFKFLIQMDGDGQHGPEDIPALIVMVKKGECDIALGSRFLGFGDYQSSFVRSAGVLFFRQLIRLLTAIKITDPTTGFQALNREVFSLFTRDFFPSDFPDADVITVLSRLKFEIKEVPVRMYPSSGRSMHHPFNVVYYLFKQLLSAFLIPIRSHQTYLKE